MHWARERYEAVGRAFANRKPLPPPKPLRRAPTIGSAADYIRREELFGLLEDLRICVWKCEDEARAEDRIDLAVKVNRS